MKIAMPILGMLIFSTVSVAQTHSVRIISETSDSKEIAEGVAARLGGATRYSIVAVPGAEIVVDITCLKLESIKGRVCNYSFDYYPDNVFLRTRIGTPGIIFDSDFVVIAEYIFDEAVKASTDAALKVSETALLKNISEYCSFPKSRKTCSIATSSHKR